MPNLLTMFSKEKPKTPPPPEEGQLHNGYLPLREIVEIKPLLWTCAQYLGDARRRSNQNRAKNRDRGKALNQQGDTLGALGELFVFFSALKHKQEDIVQYMREHLYHPGGGAQTTDTVDTPDIDIKTFGCEAHKSRIAINALSHCHLKGKLKHYYFVLSPLWGRDAVVSNLVPWEEVNDWDKYPLSMYDDPSFNIGLNTFMTRYCPQASLFGMRANCYEPADIDTHKSQAQRLLLSQVPTLR
jgi:hypothetical protein